MRNKYFLFIKKHPSEEYEKFNLVIEKNKEIVSLLNENIYSVYELSRFSETCVGMFSMLLKELEILGSKVISYQPTKFYNQLIFSGLKENPITTEHQLLENICSIEKINNKNQMDLIPKAITEIQKYIGEVM